MAMMVSHCKGKLKTNFVLELISAYLFINNVQNDNN